MAINNQVPQKASGLSMAEPTDSSPPAKRRKLIGRPFYESLGSPKMILAPMVDQSEFVRCFLVSSTTSWTDLAV